LIVDLDQTLVATDTLIENFILALCTRPLQTLRALLHLRRGRACLKKSFNDIAPLDVSALPYRRDVLKFLAGEKRRGRPIYLVTAAHQSIADRIAKRLGLFIAAKGSDGRVNLKGSSKLAWIEREAGSTFDYIGDSNADLPIWRKASMALIVSRSTRMEDKLKSAGVPVGRTFDVPRAGLKSWIKALRVHQWSKNLMIFAPLLLAQEYFDSTAVLLTTAAFALLCMAASGTYLINDLIDLAGDRAHPTKRYRALACGDISISQALSAALLMIGTALFSAAVISPGFATILLSYVVLTLTYSLVLKRQPLADVFVIGLLFMLRVVMGMAVLSMQISMWLSSFVLFLFFSLALAKRHAEVVHTRHKAGTLERTRGYRKSDWPLTIGFGIAGAFTSIVILLLYFQFEAANKGLYANIEWLYITPLILMSWFLRIWLVAQRGELLDDPVVFALKDPTSWFHAAAIVGVWLLAVHS
jgi:4-hydroxybenzoate polyprenyltransferase/phosphoserine phosphatase